MAVGNEVELGPALSVPITIDLGGVPLGESRTYAITVLNTGEQRRTIDAVTIDATDGGDEFRLEGGSCRAGTRLQPRETCTVRVTYAPAAPSASGLHSAWLSVDGQQAKLVGEDLE